MAYLDNKQNKIILEDEEKEILKECNSYFLNGKKTGLKMVEMFRDLNI